MNKVAAQRLNKPRANFPIPEGGKRTNCSHSQQEVCISWNGVFNCDSIAVDWTSSGSISLYVDSPLFTGALAGLDEKQLGLFGQRGAIGSIERFGQLPDSDGVAVYAVYTLLFAVAENATYHTVHLTVVSAAEFPHQGQHVLALTVFLNLYFEAKPLKHFVQTLWKTQINKNTWTCGMHASVDISKCRQTHPDRPWFPLASVDIFQIYWSRSY